MASLPPIIVGVGAARPEANSPMKTFILNFDFVFDYGFIAISLIERPFGKIPRSRPVMDTAFT